MNIAENIYKKIKDFEELGEVASVILLCRTTYRKLCLETNNSDVYNIFDRSVEVSDKVGDEDIVISSNKCGLSASLRTKCPICKALSYEQGYCGGCGMYRGEDQEELEEDDLCTLLSDQDEALSYGFSLLED